MRRARKNILLNRLRKKGVTVRHISSGEQPRQEDKNKDNERDRKRKKNTGGREGAAIKSNQRMRCTDTGKKHRNSESSSLYLPVWNELPFCAKDLLTPGSVSCAIVNNTYDIDEATRRDFPCLVCRHFFAPPLFYTGTNNSIYTSYFSL